MVLPCELGFPPIPSIRMYRASAQNNLCRQADRARLARVLDCMPVGMLTSGQRSRVGRAIKIWLRLGLGLGVGLGVGLGLGLGLG